MSERNMVLWEELHSTYFALFARVEQAQLVTVPTSHLRSVNEKVILILNSL